MWQETPIPLEESEPELAELFMKICSRELPYCVYNEEIYHAVYFGKKVKFGEPVVISGVEKVKRNAPCPCGSGKKYNKCCM